MFLWKFVREWHYPLGRHDLINIIPKENFSGKMFHDIGKATSLLPIL